MNYFQNIIIETAATIPVSVTNADTVAMQCHAD